MFNDSKGCQLGLSKKTILKKELPWQFTIVETFPVWDHSQQVSQQAAWAVGWRSPAELRCRPGAQKEKQWKRPVPSQRSEDKYCGERNPLWPVRLCSPRSITPLLFERPKGSKPSCTAGMCLPIYFPTIQASASLRLLAHATVPSSKSEDEKNPKISWYMCH